MRWTCFMKHRDPSPTSSFKATVTFGEPFFFTCFFFCWFYRIGNADANGWRLVSPNLSVCEPCRDGVSCRPGRCLRCQPTRIGSRPSKPHTRSEEARHVIETRCAHTNFPSGTERAGFMICNMHHPTLTRRRPASTAQLLLVIAFLCLGIPSTGTDPTQNPSREALIRHHHSRVPTWSRLSSMRSVRATARSAHAASEVTMLGP
jgi:hypothetical protein